MPTDYEALLREAVELLDRRHWDERDADRIDVLRDAADPLRAESPRLPAATAPWTRAQVLEEAAQLKGSDWIAAASMLRSFAQTLPATVPAPVAPLEYDCTTCGAHWVAVLPSRACPECCGLFIKKRDRSAPATVPAPAPADKDADYTRGGQP